MRREKCQDPSDERVGQSPDFDFDTRFVPTFCETMLPCRDFALVEHLPVTSGQFNPRPWRNLLLGGRCCCTQKAPHAVGVCKDAQARFRQIGFHRPPARTSSARSDSTFINSNPGDTVAIRSHFVREERGHSELPEQKFAQVRNTFKLRLHQYHLVFPSA